MKRPAIIVLMAVGIVLIWGASAYNNLVKRQEEMTKDWSLVENVYQRRADLVSNLIALVKDYSEYEQSTIVAVTEARAMVEAVKVDKENFNEKDLNDFDAAQEELGKSMNRLIVAVENYPDLKASESYLTLQAQIEGCENRIQTERERFNKAVKRYNQSVRRFPSSIIANMFGFEKRPYFEATSQNASQAPETF